MPFIGKTPETGAFRLIDSITTSATDTYALTVQGDHYFPESARNLIVSLNGVTQAPETAYTVSGSHIIFASALTASDVIDYILVLGDVLDIGTPSDGTVGVPQMNSALYSENEFFALPTGTTAQRPANPQDGYIRYNTTDDRVEIYSGNGWEAVTSNDITTASGGTEVTSGGYKYHTFTSSGTLTVSNGGEVELLVVAGGAGGGGASNFYTPAGGGGAGGLQSSTTTLGTGSYTVTVGSGGAGASGEAAGSNGGDSSFGAVLTSVGGGGGGASWIGSNGQSGGSGGGARGYNAGSIMYGGSGTTGQGNDGGNGGDADGTRKPGSGGGAGAAGVRGGAGGIGSEYSVWATATSTGHSGYYAGGGACGAGTQNGAPSPQAASTGGGGATGAAGLTNTGGGGGGNNWHASSAAGANGGSGIVIIRYAV